MPVALMLVGIVVFEVASSRYGVVLADVRELFRVPSIVALPMALSVVEGVVNIRGVVVPVLDIRRRFGLPAKAPHPADHLILAQAGPRLVGLRVDRALGIAHVNADDIEDAKAVSPQAEYVAGVAKLPDGLVLIHDLRTFLDVSEAKELDAALAEPLERSR